MKRSRIKLTIITDVDLCALLLSAAVVARKARLEHLLLHLHQNLGNGLAYHVANVRVQLDRMDELCADRQKKVTERSYIQYYLDLVPRYFKPPFASKLCF